MSLMPGETTSCQRPSHGRERQHDPGGAGAIPPQLAQAARSGDCARGDRHSPALPLAPWYMTRRLQTPWRVGAALRTLRRPLQRIAAFGLLPAASLLSSLILLPIISARFGQPGWSSVLLGQSIGAAASVVCGLGWHMEGADLISRATPTQRQVMYRASVRQRAVALVVASPFVVGVSLLAEPAMPLVCVLSALAIALNAFSPGWYFVGLSRPSQLLVAEGVPRIVVNLAAIALVVLLPLWSYPLALIAGVLATMAITSLYVDREARRVDLNVAPSAGTPSSPIGGRIPVLAILARGADAGSSYMSPPLVALVAPPAYPLYAAVDKLNQTLLNGMSMITRGLTAWIAEGDEPGRRRRLAAAVLVAFSLAALSLVVLTLVTPFLLEYLFAGTVDHSPVIAFLGAVVISGTFLSRALSPILLVPLGQVQAAYRILIAGACVGLPVIALAALSGGGMGALTAAAVLPWIQVAVQLGVGLRSSSRIG